MKQTLIIIFSIFCLNAAAQDREAIFKILYDQQEAWNRGDLNGFMEGYWKSDSLMFVGEKLPTYGWQKTLDHYKKSYPDKEAMGFLSFKFIKLEIIGKNDAFLFGGWNLKRETDHPGGYFTLWFRKISGSWKIVVDHTSQYATQVITP